MPVLCSQRIPRKQLRATLRALACRRSWLIYAENGSCVRLVEAFSGVAYPRELSIARKLPSRTLVDSNG
jgi:hypothetical protein